MQLSRTDVEAIARLGRLRLSDAELERYRVQLSDVLGYVEKLAAVDTSEVAETAATVAPNASLADDRAVAPNDTERLLANAPERDGTHVKVKAVFGGPA